jgi:hypothetical protein
MSDYGEIVSTLVRIQHSVDQQDREAFKDCWTEDMQLHLTMFDGTRSTIPSREDLIARFTAHWTGQPSAMRHAVNGVEVQITGPATARASFYCTYLNVGAEPSLAGMGEYHDELVKSPDGKWRVKLRRHAFLTPLAIRQH